MTERPLPAALLSDNSRCWRRQLQCAPLQAGAFRCDALHRVENGSPRLTRQSDVTCPGARTGNGIGQAGTAVTNSIIQRDLRERHFNQFSNLLILVVLPSGSSPSRMSRDHRLTGRARPRTVRLGCRAAVREGWDEAGPAARHVIGLIWRCALGINREYRSGEVGDKNMSGPSLPLFCAVPCCSAALKPVTSQLPAPSLPAALRVFAVSGVRCRQSVRSRSRKPNSWRAT
jgi:hypothetical protein